MSTPAAEPLQYAVFYETEQCTDLVEMFYSEEAAASFANSIESYTDGWVFGVQRSDGALEPAKTWPMFLQLREHSKQELKKTMEEQRRNPPERRKITCPFNEHRVIWVETDDNIPDWVGKRGET